MSETAEGSLTLLSIVRQWPIASNIAKHLPAGSLINLSRSSTSLRGVLHGFDDWTTVEPNVTADLPTHTTPEDVIEDVSSCRVLHIGAHRTPCWEGLKRAAPFACSSKTHTKGNKTKPCLYCSMPVCESCIVKHSFAKTENTFKNRCRFMCQRCWDTENVQKQRRYSGRPSAADRRSHKSEFWAGQFCTCTSKDGWVCNDCKEKQNQEARLEAMTVCYGEKCAIVLDTDKDRRKICLWCDKPMPRGRASLESKIAFDQKIMDGWGREISSEMPIIYHCGGDLPTHHPRMCMSRREMRGNRLVQNDPDADLQQFLSNLDIFNYLRLCDREPTGDEIYYSKLGRWKYNRDFLKCFMYRCSRRADAAFLRNATSSNPSNDPPLKTNLDLSMMKCGWHLSEYPGDRVLYGPTSGRWMYTREFLEYFMYRCSEHKDALILRQVTSCLSPDGLRSKTNMDLWGTKYRKKMGDDTDMVELSERIDAAFYRSFALTLDEMEDCHLTQELLLDGRASLHNSELSTETGAEQEFDDDDDSTIQGDETAEAQKKPEAQVRPVESSSTPGVVATQTREPPPEYGADTLILEGADAVESHPNVH
jgi:hypothetical protein